MATPEFILKLREMIGTHELWLPGVTALVRDDTGLILLGQRSDNGLWALPSGIADPGEEMAATCAREVLEETGVEIEVSDLIAIRTTPPVVYPNGDRTLYVDHFFLCTPLRGEARVCDDESVAVGWFGVEALPEPLAPVVRQQLAEADAFARTGRTLFAR